MAFDVQLHTKYFDQQKVVESKNRNETLFLWVEQTKVIFVALFYKP